MALALAHKRPRFDEDMPSPMEPTCSPHRMLVLESPASKRTRLGQLAAAEEEARGETSSPFQGCASADAAGDPPLPRRPAASLPPQHPRVHFLGVAEKGVKNGSGEGRALGDAQSRTLPSPTRLGLQATRRRTMRSCGSSGASLGRAR